MYLPGAKAAIWGKMAVVRGTGCAFVFTPAATNASFGVNFIRILNLLCIKATVMVSWLFISF